MISSHKKKLVRQKAVNTPPPPLALQSLFTRENNLNCDIPPYHHNPLTRSLSTESSTFKSVENNSSYPTKFLYRRR